MLAWPLASKVVAPPPSCPRRCDGAGRQCRPPGGGGHGGREGHRLAGDGRVERRARATVVAARVTVTAAAAEVLPVKPPMPAKEAVSAWSPTPSDTESDGLAGGVDRREPSTVLPSRKVTVPVGVPAGEFTVAVSTSVCPKTAVAVEVPSVVVVVRRWPAHRRGPRSARSDRRAGPRHPPCRYRRGRLPSGGRSPRPSR